MGHLLSREGPILSSGERQAIIRRVVDEALGLGILEPLLADPSVTEIMVNGHETIFVERAGVLQRLDAHFASEDQLMQTIDRIVAGVNRRVDESSPMVDARLATGERVNVIVPPLALDGPMLTIRRFPRAYTLAELVDQGRAGRGERAAARRAGARPLQRHRLGRYRHRQDHDAQRAVGLHPRRTSASSRSRTPPSCSCSRST